MKLGRLNHIGVATPSIADSIVFYRDVMGATKIHEPFDLPDQGGKVCFVDTPGAGGARSADPDRHGDPAAAADRTGDVAAPVRNEPTANHEEREAMAGTANAARGGEHGGPGAVIGPAGPSGRIRRAG